VGPGNIGGGVVGWLPPPTVAVATVTWPSPAYPPPPITTAGTRGKQLPPPPPRPDSCGLSSTACSACTLTWREEAVRFGGRGGGRGRVAGDKEEEQKEEEEEEMKGYQEEETGFKGSNKGDANNNGCNSSGCNNNGGRQRQQLGGAAMAVQGAVKGRGHCPLITEMLDW
jgi:hypothetical protein